jgi:hypothetical protein
MRPKLFKAMAVPLALISFAALSTPVGDITDVVVTESGVGSRSDDCSSFVITSAQARAFFERAIVISGSQEHDFFLYGPCSARGTFKNRYDTWRWEIRNLGTATITATNGDTFRLGDPAQESPLGEE